MFKHLFLLRALTITTLLIGITTNGYANTWAVDKQSSSIDFVTVKKTHITEAHSFEDFSGTISANGNAKVVIKTASVETGVGIRNDRIRQFLFKSANFPEIVVDTNINALPKLSAGQSTQLSLPATLSLHGVKKPVTLNVVVSQSDKAMTVASTKPIIVKASDYKLSPGVLKLSELMGNIAIGEAVPVSFVLTFKQS